MLSRQERRELRNASQPFRDGGTCMGVVSGVWPRTYCSRNGTIERSGNLYCRQHDPGDPEENRQKRLAKYAAMDAKIESDAAQSERRRLEETACAGLSNDELKQIIDGRMRLA